MATRFSHTARIDAPVEVVFTSYGDEAYWNDRISSVGSPQDSLDDFSVSGDTVSVTVTQHIPEEDIPEMARKFLPGQLVIVRTSVYNPPAAGTFTSTAKAQAAGGLGLIDGSAEAVALGDASEEAVSGQVKVAVPLLGGKLEKLVVAHLDRLLVSEYRHLNQWVTR